MKQDSYIVVTSVYWPSKGQCTEGNYNVHPHSHAHIRTNIHAQYNKNNSTDEMHDYCKLLLVIDFTHAKHCKDKPTAAVVSKYTCTYNGYTSRM